jgi:hypothetical protein
MDFNSPEEAAKTAEGMRVFLTALLHQLGGSAVVPEVELHRIRDKRMTVHVVQSEDMYMLREVQG